MTTVTTSPPPRPPRRWPLRLGAAAVPYLTVGLGLHVLHSGWAAILGYNLGMVTVLTLARHWPRARKEALAGWHPGWVALAAAGSGLSGLAFIWLWPWLDAQARLDAALADWGLAGDGAWLAFCVTFCAVTPWLEESYWRGFLGSPARRLYWSDPLFAAYHLLVMAPLVDWPWLLVALGVLTGAAWWWRQIARQQGGLAVPILAHLAADLSVVLAGSFLRS